MKVKEKVVIAFFMSFFLLCAAPAALAQRDAPTRAMKITPRAVVQVSEAAQTLLKALHLGAAAPSGIR